MENLIVALINSTANLYAKIALHFGWKLSFETSYDCMDCFYHMIRNIGLLIIQRHVINGKVIFKLRKFTWKEHFLTCGLFATMVVNIIIFINNHYDPNMALHELVWFVLYTTGSLFNILMASEFVRNRKILERIGYLHEEADLAMRQLGLHFDYRFAIVSILSLVGWVYTNWIFLVISFWIIRSETIYDQINYSILSFFFVMLVSTSLFFYSGQIYVCSVRFIVLNKFIDKEVDKLDDDYMYDEENQWPTTFNSAEIAAKLRLISTIHMKHYELTKEAMKFSSVFLMGFVHLEILATAVIIYFYFFKQILLIELLLIDLTGLTICVILSICGEGLKRQAKYTLTLMADWSLCSFDPDTITIMNAILMQASHENFEPEAGGVVPINTTMLIFIVEISISVVVFFIQSSV